MTPADKTKAVIGAAAVLGAVAIGSAIVGGSAPDISVDPPVILRPDGGIKCPQSNSFYVIDMSVECPEGA